MRQSLTLLFTLFTCFAYTQDIEVITQEKTQGVVTILSYSPDGSLLASGSAKENSVKVWDILSGKIIGKLDGHDKFTTALMFNADGTQLVSSAKDNYLIVWDIVNWKMVDSIKITSPITWMVKDPNDDDRFYSGSKEGLVQQWSFSSLETPKTLFEETSPIIRMDCSKLHLAVVNLS